MSALGSVMSVPSKVMVPLVGVSSRFRQRRKVDLPEPEGPMTTTFSPGLMWLGDVVQHQVVAEGLGQRFLTSITLTQPPFQFTLEPGEDHDQDQIHAGDADVGVTSRS